MADRAAADIEGEKQFRIKVGYGSLIEWLVKGLAGDLLHLQTKVREIRWKQNQVEVLAYTPNGERIFSASRLIVTLPLGVLKGVLGQTGSHPIYASTVSEEIHARTSGSWTRDKDHDLF
jgi:protoporphyrinogen oxidase